MEKRIVRANDTEYMTVSAEGDMIFFKNFGKSSVTVGFDARVLDLLIPFLTEVNFWNKVKEKPNETSN